MRPLKYRSLSRVLGIVLMALALGMALDPDYPLPEGEFPRIRVPDDLLTKFPVTIAPRGIIQGYMKAFRWRWQGRARSWQVVVFDQSAEELFRSAPVSGDTWRPAADQLQRLGRGRLYWYVSSGEGPRRLQSNLQSFTIQAAR